MSFLIFCCLNKRFIISAPVDFSLEIKHKIIKMASYTTEFLNDVTRSLGKNLKCLRQKHIYILYGEPESQTGGAPGRGIHGWEVKVEGSGGHRPAPARAAPPVTTRFGVMRLDVIIPGVKPLDSGAGCIWVNSASSLDSLKGNKTRLIKAQHLGLRNEGRVEVPKTAVSRTAPKASRSQWTPMLKCIQLYSRNKPVYSVLHKHF